MAALLVTQSYGDNVGLRGGDTTTLRMNEIVNTGDEVAALA